MSFTIGRATFASNPISANHSGDRLSLVVDISPATTSGSVGHAKVLRQQVLGLADNPDESVVPVTWSDDPDWDGFYRVVGTSIEPGPIYLSNGFMRCQIELERVGGGYAKAQTEVSAACALMANDHGTTNDRARVGIPQATSSFYGFEYSLGTFEFTDETLTSDTGTVVTLWTGTMGFASASYYVPPSSAYVGAATFEVQIDGQWWPMVGRQLPIIPPGAWRVTNGIIRITPVEVGGLKYGRVERFDGSSWSTLIDIEPGLYLTGWRRQEFGTAERATNTTGNYVQPIIMRNSPEVVSIKIPAAASTSTTITLHRGAQHLEITRVEFVGQPGLGSRTAIASTDGTDHIRRTAAGGYFISMPKANTVDTTNARIYRDTSVTLADATIFGVGYYAGANNVTAALTAVSEVARVVAR